MKTFIEKEKHMAAKKQPNILIIWGDDIGWFNVSAYNHGIMGYRTPNIDRIAKEGAMFTDWYGQQSCTAGRAAFITGQSPIRTGLTKVGLPGPHWVYSPKTQLSPTFSSPSVTYAGSSARTISVIETSFCRRYMALKSSSGISTT
jgi:Sulfatase